MVHKINRAKDHTSKNLDNNDNVHYANDYNRVSRYYNAVAHNIDNR